MGVNTLDALAIGGGVPLLCFISLISGHSLLSSCSLPLLLPSWQIFRQSGQIFGKKWQKLDFIWYALVFSRDFRRPKEAKFKIYLSFEGARASVVALLCWRWSCPLGAGGAGAGLPVFCGVCSVPFSLPFVRFTALLSLCWLANMPYSAF